MIISVCECVNELLEAYMYVCCGVQACFVLIYTSLIPITYLMNERLWNQRPEIFLI